MFEKIGRLAETAATKVSLSRRGFLGRLGQGALAVTGVVGGLLALPRDAHAGTNVRSCINACCEFWCGKGDPKCSCDPTGNTYYTCVDNCFSSTGP
jgi:hypothetical protein